MIAFAVIVRDKLGDGTPKVTLPDWNDPIEALVFDRSHEALGVPDFEGDATPAGFSRVRPARFCTGYGSAKVNTLGALPCIRSGATRSSAPATPDGPVMTAMYCLPSAAKLIG